MRLVVSYDVPARIPKKGSRAGKPTAGMAWLVRPNANMIGGSMGMIAARKAAQRKMALRALLAAFGDGPLPVQTEAGEPNRFTVTITRHSAGFMDDDGLSSSAKWCRDIIAFWIQRGGAATRVEGWERKLGRGDDAIAWKYAQEPAKKGTYRVTIAIEDLRAAPDRVVTAEQVAAAPPTPPPAKPAKRKPKAAQLAVVETASPPAKHGRGAALQARAKAAGPAPAPMLVPAEPERSHLPLGGPYGPGPGHPGGVENCATCAAYLLTHPETRMPARARAAAPGPRRKVLVALPSENRDPDSDDLVTRDVSTAPGFRDAPPTVQLGDNEGRVILARFESEDDGGACWLYVEVPR
jgi:hypothetical protein